MATHELLPSAHVFCRMLNLTGCGPKDTVFDLGCGDGRVVGGTEP